MLTCFLPKAYKLGMYGGKYVWLLLDWYDNKAWWLMKDHHVDCTQDQLTRATNGYFSIENLNPVTDGKPGISGLVCGSAHLYTYTMIFKRSSRYYYLH